MEQRGRGGGGTKVYWSFSELFILFFIFIFRKNSNTSKVHPTVCIKYFIIFLKIYIG